LNSELKPTYYPRENDALLSLETKLLT
jgi:hypothetical protein